MSKIIYEDKVIRIQNIITEIEKELKIYNGKTIKQLKSEIIKLFNLNYDLNNQDLRMQKPGMSSPKIITREKENDTLYKLHIVNDTYIYFGQQQNNGGSKIISIN